ncbi:unnamed protein product [Lasius platythorax]|uniref:Uncharacterized protein n=1 Tax=Lasius platythorax TaxID=488582 RepID=A0AAV2NVP0_9HYME
MARWCVQVFSMMSRRPDSKARPDDRRYSSGDAAIGPAGMSVCAPSEILYHQLMKDTVLSLDEMLNSDAMVPVWVQRTAGGSVKARF